MSKAYHAAIQHAAQPTAYKENGLNGRLPENQSAQQAGHLLFKRLIRIFVHGLELTEPLLHSIGLYWLCSVDEPARRLLHRSQIANTNLLFIQYRLINNYVAITEVTERTHKTR